MRLTIPAILGLVVALTAGAPSSAATIEALDLNAPKLSEEESGHPFRCHYRLTGVIENGDIEKFKPIAIDGGLLCLDSPGGSFGEAVRFLELMKEKNQGTRLEAGKTCESACALIFMAGIQWAFEGERAPWREMHHTAKLGFHSPALVVPDGNYEAASVNKSYLIALKSVSDVITQLIVNKEENGGNLMKPSLLSTMLATPPQEMSYVDTVGKAGRWKIKVVPELASMPLTDENLKTLCRNVMAWSVDDEAPVKIDENSYTLEVTKDNSEADTTWWKVDQLGMNARGCKIAMPKGITVTDEYGVLVIPYTDNSDDSTVSAANIDFLNPSTPLATINFNASSTPAPAQPSSQSSPQSCFVVSNGTITDDDPCTRIVREDNTPSGGPLIVEYLWPSGGKTVLEVAGKNRQINGKLGIAVRAPAGRQGDCTLNTASGNVFCADPG